MQHENPNDNSVEKDIAALSDMALQHYQEGHLQRALRLHPDYFDARIDLALVPRHLGRAAAWASVKMPRANAVFFIMREARTPTIEAQIV